MNKLASLIKVLVLSLCFLGSGILAYTPAENRSSVDEAERQLEMIRMFIWTLKNNVTAEEGDFPLEKYPAEFKDEAARAIHVVKKAGTVVIAGTSYATSVEVRITEGASERPELYAVLGEQGSLKYGDFRILAGNPDPDQAMFRLRFLLDDSGANKPVIEAERSDGWGFTKDKDVVKCQDGSGGHSEYRSGMVCVYPGQLAQAEMSALGERIRSRVEGGEEFLSAAAAEGLTCN